MGFSTAQGTAQGVLKIENFVPCGHNMSLWSNEESTGGNNPDNQSSITFDYISDATVQQSMSPHATFH